ncbi:MAG: hypothetical protein COA58_12750 [Bacteroidetes bacterium]|nr:MAG: hypothetical protein COA58_12750 [Bacteroidota bacterium]
MLATSCFKKDAVLPKKSPDSFEINLSIKGNQASYINLTNLQNSYDGKTANWHLKFQNDELGWYIYLNTLQNVAIHNTTETDYDLVDQDYNILDLPWQLDIPASQGSQPAIGEWGDFNFPNPKSFKNVYLISWNDGITSFVYKLQILDASTDRYHLRYGTLDGAITKSVWITKDKEHRHSYFSFKSGSDIQIEPKVNDWNFCFTYLQDSIISHKNIPHATTINKSFGLYQGVIINQSNTQIFLDTSNSFDDIDFFFARDLEYNTIDEIINLFYTWNINSQSIEASENLTLITKDENRYYALKAEELEGSSIEDIRIKLKIKQL